MTSSLALAFQQRCAQAYSDQLSPSSRQRRRPGEPIADYTQWWLQWYEHYLRELVQVAKAALAAIAPDGRTWNARERIDQAFDYTKSTALDVLLTEIPPLNHALLHEPDDTAFKQQLEVIIEAFDVKPAH